MQNRESAGAYSYEGISLHVFVVYEHVVSIHSQHHLIPGTDGVVWNKMNPGRDVFYITAADGCRIADIFIYKWN